MPTDADTAVVPPAPAEMLRSLDALADEVGRRIGGDLPAVARMFRATTANTLATTVRPQPDGTCYVITGDIPAMWLRDSAAQVRPYLLLAAEQRCFADLLVGVVRRQLSQICHDPYANAFNETASGAHHDGGDRTEMSPLVWERKYELDSLCYPIRLAYQVWRVTGRTDHLGATFRAAAARILDTWDTELDHDTTSTYRFFRPGEGLARGGLGTPTASTGLIWSGFRPSDDPCERHFLVPANAFAALAAEELADLLTATAADPATVAEPAAMAAAARARTHAARLRRAMAAHALVDHPEYGRIYAYEVDGLGGAVLMDDANVPSLLSLPYLGWCPPDDPVYLATRRFVLSEANPYRYAGRALAGVGSPHVPGRYVWPIALVMQGLTTTDPAERVALLRTLAATDAGTGLMHEAVHADDPANFTRPWFAWANSLFSELVLLHAGLPVPGTPPGLLGATGRWAG
ncbi:glycoside hydrolase family 125 protein [Micromonospora globbae]|uniref:glycoside hydrolase family 125 protein n=1 Tax=Micromonospora globbae TaxID=1894969 RepID=UPI00343C613E